MVVFRKRVWVWFLLLLIAANAGGREGVSLDKRVLEQFDLVAGDYCRRNEYCETLFMLGTGQWRLAESNLVGNPGFEEVDDRGIPVGWNRTPVEKLPEGAVIDTVLNKDPEAEFGIRSGRISTGGSAFFLRSASGVKSGEPYFVEADARLSHTEGGMSSDARVYLQVGWRGSDGWIRSGGVDFFSNDLQTRDAWTRLGMPVIAPDSATHAQIFLRVENLCMDEEEVLFDNVSLRKIVKPLPGEL